MQTIYENFLTYSLLLLGIFMNSLITKQSLKLCDKMDAKSIGADNECQLKNLEDFFEKIITSRISLRDYKNILDVVNTLNNDLKTFYESFVESGQDIKNIDKVCIYSIHKTQKDLLEKKYHKELYYYSPYYLNKLKQDLKSWDQEIMSEFKKQVIKEVHKQGGEAPDGNPSARVKDKTEMNLIHHIVGLSNPRISIRDLFSRAWYSISSLKPCFLLSPLTVSQTLPLDQQYDVLIIDEASQVKPEYAIASTVRAKQIVIVGDQKQLPPTDFFQITKETEEEDEDDSGESILDKALTALPYPKSLLWHYRSRHESLIKFSDQKFYNEQLIFPFTVDTNNKNKGIKHIYLKTGTYRSRSSTSSGGSFNEIEAKQVVSEIIKFMKERPKESLGVATMNRAQTEFIENQFDIVRIGNPDVENFLNVWEKKDEGLNEFFIKNLENVQGDERDVLFISTVYGPDQKSGKVFQRFGPIAGKHGHRRLNVLFTRAKNQIVLFTSLKSSDIQSENKSQGVQALKGYLHFAETGNLPPSGKSNDREIESPFQKWAIDQIDSFPGFSADWEIGVKGYRIDIGVKHENYPYGYIMAIETDGASYHSIKSARDRDKLKQEILESHGWKFHRIWSTDWLRDPVKVKKNLKEVLNNRLKELNIQE